MYGSGLDGAFASAIFGFGAAAFALGALAVWLIPIFWGWLKPIIHMATG